MPCRCRGKAVGFMEGYQTVRCLFCETGKEESVVERVHKSGVGRAIFARRSGTKRQNGTWIETLRPLLPGYVFVYCHPCAALRRRTGGSDRAGSGICRLNLAAGRPDRRDEGAADRGLD